MATARDQVEAYAFAARRQVLALVQGDDAIVTDPRRRLNRSFFGGLILSIFLLAIVGVAGFLSGGSSASVPSSGVILGSDGGRYVIVDNVLHPALNLASANLIAGSSVTTVATSALDELPRGLPVGIPGAPDALPAKSRLDTGRWMACSITPSASAAKSEVLVSVGALPTAVFPPGRGVVATTPDGTEWLLDDGLRFQVPSAAATLLGLDRVVPVPLQPELIDLIPEGPALTVPSIDGSGQAPATQLPFAAVVGDVVEVDYGTADPGRYVVLDDGVAPVDAFAFALLSGGAKETLHVPASQIVNVASKSKAPVPAQWPDQALELTGPPQTGAPLCLTYDPTAPHAAGAWSVSISEPPRIPLPPGATPVTAANGSLPTVATGIAITPGNGALVRATGAGGVDSVYTLVTDSGLRFPIATTDAVSRLGYTTASAVAVPLPFLDLLPSGPALDPAAAAQEYPGTAQPAPATATPVPSSSPSS